MRQQLILHTFILLATMLACILIAGQASAQVPPGNCTSDPGWNIPLPAAGTGIITTVVNNISFIMNGVAQQLYNTILGNPDFVFIVRASLTLYIIIYGILFLFGMTQITMMDFIMRMLKIGIIAGLLSPNSWNFFYNTVGVFFHEGTDWLIAQMAQIAVGAVPGLNPGAPFAVLDNSIAILTSSKMAATLIATFFTGPYGLLFGLLILFSLGTFGAALFQAMWVYLMALVVRSFLFGLAIIFFIFLLFDRTRHLFDGFINQLLSATLQPVFLFTFFAFFAKLVEAAMFVILRVPVCLVDKEGLVKGGPFGTEMYRFMLAGGVPDQIANVEWTFKGPIIPGVGLVPGAPVFPIGILDVLILLLLVQLAWRFPRIAIHVASDIAGASLRLNISGQLANWLSPTRPFTHDLSPAAKQAAAKFRADGGGGGAVVDARAGAGAGVGGRPPIGGGGAPPPKG